MIGQTIQINSEPYTAVGVFSQGVADRWDWEFIVPLVFNREQLLDHDSPYLAVTGRLKPGVTIKQAQTELDCEVGTGELARSYHPPCRNFGFSLSVHPYCGACTGKD